MIILVGPSASGKTELGKKLENYNINKNITYTTRIKRCDEVEARDYYFISKEEFINKINDNFFFEYTIYNNNYYGTSNKSINTNSYVILEPTGLLKYKDLENVISFFIDVDKETRFNRMHKRKDDEAKIKERLEIDDTIFNDDIKNACNYILDGSLDLDVLAKIIIDKIKR